MTAIRFHEITKYYGATIAVDGVTLSVAAGELFFLLGPSGCGKTTLLRILAGFVPADAGEIYFADTAVTHLPPRLRNTGMVFQTYALWPHLTVADNVAYGLRVRGGSRAEIANKVEQVLKLVRMEEYGTRRPNQLSGGQQQRVALARALVIEPRVLLLDEPLSNLDARLRDEMRDEIRRLHTQTGLTTVYVTHDQKEALALADRLAVMDRGKLVQVGTPAEVYERPATRFVAGFLGESNFITGTVRQCGDSQCLVETPLGPIRGVTSSTTLKAGSAAVCSVRPHALTLATDSGDNRIPVHIERSAFLGDHIELRLVVVDGTPLLMTAPPHLAGGLRQGESVMVSAPAERVVVLEA